MKALILAAGKGERLRPITQTKPKPLLPILCKPLIEWQIHAIEKYTKVEELVIVVSYMKEKIAEYLAQIRPSIPIKIVDQGKELGTGDAVIKGILDMNIDDEVLIIYGDIFLKDWGILEKLVNIEDNALLAAEVNDPYNYGVLLIENNTLKKIVEKPREPVSNLVNAGIYKLRVEDILRHKDIEFSPRGELEFTDILQKIASDKRIRVLNIDKDAWIDIGMPWNLIEANKIALKNLKHEIKGKLEDQVTIKQPVYIGENTIVRSGTYIEGPVYIDKEADIGPNARIRPNTVICRGSKIGFSVEVKESIIMENVHASHLSYIGDSIVCEHVNLGAGTITANLRFDNKPVKMTIKGVRVSSGRRKLGAIIGAYVKTGVNVSLMPGVKIGAYSWIAPGAIVYRDIPPRSFYRAEIKYIISDLERKEIDDQY